MIPKLLPALVFWLLSLLPALAGVAPQYIAFAFDGSKSLRMWQETLDFARENDVHFTFFVSGPNFIADEYAGYYKGPRHRAGRSDIGFGGSVEEVAARIAFVRRAYREGHEIASHANGHWDATNWSEDEWIDELKQFQDIMANTHRINGIPDNNPREWRRIVGSITGFRAPLLISTPAGRRALATMGYSYDTSRTNSRDYWPAVGAEGLWNFPLASLPLSKGSVLSMDYNFLVLNNATGSDPQTQMQNAYVRYFNHNYTGSRAPMHIGHHFSLWKGGAYWRALQSFAATVCPARDVVCGTYSNLEKNMPRYLRDRPVPVGAETTTSSGS